MNHFCYSIKDIENVFIKRFGVKPKLIEPYYNKTAQTFSNSTNTVNTWNWIIDKPWNSTDWIRDTLNFPLFFGTLDFKFSNQTAATIPVTDCYLAFSSQNIDSIDFAASAINVGDADLLARYALNWSGGLAPLTPGQIDYLPYFKTGANLLTNGFYLAVGTRVGGVINMIGDFTFQGYRVYFR